MTRSDVPAVTLDAAAECDPVAAEGIIVTGTIAGTVVALAAASLEVAWSSKLKGTAVAGVTVAQGTVVATVQYGGVSAGKGIVARLSIGTGEVLWTRRARATIGTAPIVVGDAVLFGANEPGLYGSGALACHALADGKERWTRTIAPFSGVPQRVGDRLVLSAHDGSVWCMDVANGEVHWHFRMNHQLAGTPCIADDVVYVGGFDHTLYALRLQDGGVLWRRAAKGPFRAAPVVHEGSVYAGCHDEHVYALDAHTGGVLWQRGVGAEVLSSAAITDGDVLVGCNDGTVHALDRRSGQPRWRWDSGQSTRGGVIARPLVDGRRAIVFSRDCGVYVLDAATGTSLVATVGGERRRSAGQGSTAMREQTLARMWTRSGRVVVCDPIADPSTLPLALDVTAGPHPVVAVVLTRDGEEVVAALELRVTAAAPVAWRATTHMDGSVGTVGVDSAHAAFLDERAARALLEDADLVDRFDALEGSALGDSAAAAWSWAAARLAGDEIDAVLCSSGYGDGVYDVSAGYDAEGRLCRIRILFVDEAGDTQP